MKMKKLIKYILLWFFLLWINQTYADLDFIEAPSQITCASLWETYLYWQPIFSNDWTKLYYVSWILNGSEYTFYLKFRSLTNVFDCSSYTATATTLYSTYANWISRIIEYENFIYLITFSTSQWTDLYRFDLETNTLSSILYNNLTSSKFHLDLTNWNLYLNTSSWNVLIYNVSWWWFESIWSTTTASMPWYIASYIYDNFLYSSNTLNPLSINKYQIINTNGVFSFNLVDNFSFTWNFSSFSSLFSWRSLWQNYFYYLYNSGTNIINQKIWIINNYTPPTEFNLMYIVSKQSEQLYSWFKTYITSIYDVDTWNDVATEVFYYIEYLSWTGSEYPLTTSTFRVWLSPQIVTFPYHFYVWDYKATAKFLFNDVSYDLFEFNYTIVKSATPGDVWTSNCSIFDYNCDWNVWILDWEFLMWLWNWFQDLISFSIITDKLNSINDFFEGFSPTDEVKTFSFIPSANAWIMNDFNVAYDSNPWTSLFQKIIWFLKWWTAFLVLIFLISWFYHLKHKQND